MKKLIIILLIIGIAVFTGTWIFDGMAWLFDLIASGLKWMSKIFNLFGWNRGILWQQKKREEYF